MSPTTFIRYGLSVVVIATVTMVGSLPSTAAQEETPTARPPAASSTGNGLGMTAAGSSDDSQDKCLARIPEDASAGQRMVAEQGCERDQGDRKSIQAVPGR